SLGHWGHYVPRGVPSMRMAAGAAVIAAAAGAAWFATYHSRPAVERAEEHWGLLDSYCVDCHNAAELTAGLSLESVAPVDVPRQAEIFEHVVRKLRGGLMPPPGNPQPDAARVASFVSWLEEYL